MSGYLIKYGGTVIASTENSLFAPISATIDKQKNTSDAFSFTLPRNHRFIDVPQVKDKIVRVVDDTGTIYAGDVLSIDTDVNGDKTFRCCGALDWLQSAIRWNQAETTTTANAYFAGIVTTYNSLSGTRAIKAGRCAFSASFTPIRYENQYVTTAQLLQDLQNDKGGMVWCDYIGDDIVLNIADYPWNRKSFEVSANDVLTNIAITVDGSSIVTRFVPVGDEGLRISSVNDGKVYVLSDTVNAHGYIVGTETYTEITNATKLKTVAQRKVNRLGNANQSISATVANQYGSNRIRVGDKVKIYGGFRFDVIDTECVGVFIDLVNPSNSTATLGGNIKTLTNIVNSVK